MPCCWLIVQTIGWGFPITLWAALLSVRVPPGISRLDHSSTYRQFYRICSVLSTAAIDVRIASSIHTLTYESLYTYDDKKAVFDPLIRKIFLKLPYRKTSSVSLTYILIRLSGSSWFQCNGAITRAHDTVWPNNCSRWYWAPYRSLRCLAHLFPGRQRHPHAV